MFKKSFYIAAVFSTAMFASCQHDPQVVNSTWHKPGEGGNISQKSAKPENGNQNVNHEPMSSNSMNQNSVNSAETNLNIVRPKTNSNSSAANKP